MLIAAQAARARHVAGEEDRHRQLQVADQLFVQRFQLFQPFNRKRPACGRGICLRFHCPYARQYPKPAPRLSDISMISAQRRDSSSASSSSGDPRQIELDGGIQHVDIVRQPAQLFFLRAARRASPLQPFQHGFPSRRPCAAFRGRHWRLPAQEYPAPRCPDASV